MLVKILTTQQTTIKVLKPKMTFYVIAIPRFPSGQWPNFLEFVNEAMKKFQTLEAMMEETIASDLKLEQPIKHENPKGADITPKLLYLANMLKVIKRRNHNNKNAFDQIDIYLKKNAELMEKALAEKLKELTPIKKATWNTTNLKGFKDLFILFKINILWFKL